ncbi:MAG: hypothetical protein KKB59_07410, partial [Spirochaetes bacterium]|nr:hypothetical protein [Spirochaetota bacterium]
MSQKSDSDNPFALLLARLRDRALFRDPERVRRYGAVAAAAFACLASFVGFGAVSGSVGRGGFEVGKVADRDIVAEDDVVYVDAKVTKIRTDAELRLVPAVFSIDDAVTKTALSSLLAFKKGFIDLVSEAGGKEGLALKARGRFPYLGASDLPERLADYPAPANALEQGRIVLEALMKRGVFAIPDAGLERYNPESLELRRWTDGPLVYEQVPIEKAATIRRARAASLEIARSLKLSATMAALAADISVVFARENAFFDEEQSLRRLDAAKARVEPVMRKISKGDKVIRQGFIVTTEDMDRLAALRGSETQLDPLVVVAGILLLALFGFGAVAVLGPVNTGVRLDGARYWFALAVAVGYFVAASAMDAFLPASLDYQFEAFLPTALAAMLVAILVGERFAILYVVMLASSLVLVTGFDAFVPAQAILSGLAGIILVRRAERRIDLVRAGGQLALVR